MTGDLAGSLIRAGVAGGVSVVVAIEALSVFGGLSRATAALAGIGALLVAGAMLRREPRSPAPPRWLTGPAGALLGTIFAVTFVVALAAAPNNWDSMTYHLTRVEHWFSLGSVAHYPTAIDRQVWQPPFAEYLVAVAMGWSGGGDRLANLVQWLAFVGAVAAVARVTRTIGGDGAAGSLAALLAATLPSAVLQATSTQNDLLVGFWLVAGLGFALDDESSRPRSPWWVGAALALAVGTKGTALVFGLPLVGFYGIRAARRDGLGGAGRRVAIVGLVMAALNGPWLLRNWQTYQSPLGDPIVQRLLRPASMAPNVVASNLVAQASLHWATPGSIGERVGRPVLEGANRLLGVDPAEAYPYFGGFRLVPWSTDEDLAGAPLYLLLLVGAIALAVRERRQLTPEAIAIWWLAGAAAILLAMTVRWRLVVGALATASAVPPLLMNLTRPLVSAANPLGVRSVLAEDRAAQYFARRPEDRAGYRAAVDRVTAAGCRVVGIKASYDSWEYPLWALARSDGRPLRFFQIEVANATARHAVGNGDEACAIVALDQPPEWRPTGPREWVPAGRDGRIAVWLPGPAAR
ncbi:MAG: DUF2029 domain-containing protein [Gemmatimonadetes bacterium]|nr:DUF2029 domain-containing protein [Gemmatimonadota bacterium]